MGEHTATVEVLTAEVRVLMVGSRQITLSVYRQLDEVPLGTMTPFGRVQLPNDVRKDPHGHSRIKVVGADREGQLCASWLHHYDYDYDRHPYSDPGGTYANDDLGDNEWGRLAALPLIVLAGLR